MFALEAMLEGHDKDTFAINLCTSPMLHIMIHPQIGWTWWYDSLTLLSLKDGKYFAKNFCANSSYVVMRRGGKEFNQTFALSLSEKGKSLSRITSSVTPLCLKVSQISKKFAIWTLGSYCDSPPNWTVCCIIWMMAGLISKLLACMAGLLMLDIAPLTKGIA